MASYTGGAREETRIRAMEEERAARKKEVERQKGAIASAAGTATGLLAGRNFATHKDTVEDLLKSDTVGLVTHEDFKARREYLEKCAAEEREKRNAQMRLKAAETRKQQLRKGNIAKLSFANDDDDSEGDSSSGSEAETGKTAATRKRPSSAVGDDSGDGASQEGDEVKVHSPKRPRISKNPDADTDFLPGRDRELAEEAERERLKQEWINEQERRKNELVNITYSYWDGSGHRRVLRCKKGTTIGRFLSMVQTQFKELRNVSANDLVFIKEDLIIPHHYSFDDLIVSKARGKSGPLFNFDVVEEVRLLADANKEKQDAHAAKVVERRWYERNRHIFPTSRWTTFDPKKKVLIRCSPPSTTPCSRRLTVALTTCCISSDLCERFRYPEVWRVYDSWELKMHLAQAQIGIGIAAWPALSILPCLAAYSVRPRIASRNCRDIRILHSKLEWQNEGCPSRLDERMCILCERPGFYFLYIDSSIA